MNAAIAARRVVVTGIGAISPVGNTFAETWTSLINEQCGVTSLEKALGCQNLTPDHFDREWNIAKDLPSQVAAPVVGGRDAESSLRATSRFVQLGLYAGGEALAHAGMHSMVANDDPEARYRIGVSMGSGMSSVREIVEVAHTVHTAGLKRISPHFVPKVLSNSVAGRLAIEFGLKGPNLTSSTACAAATHSIGEAFQCVKWGNADVMLAGGAEAAIDPYSLNGFCRLRALSTSWNDQPSAASRPFDERRDGFVMGEGAAVLVLEELQHALKRKSPQILAEVIGYGLSGDGYHITAPDPTGNGAARSMRMALQSTGLPELLHVDYVNAHATSTPKGDEIEARVIDQVFFSNDEVGDGSSADSSKRPVYVSSIKGAVGHLLGAAGALEAAVCVQSLATGCIPPTLNLDQPSEPSRFHHVQRTMHVPSLRVALSNSFGFGGTNATLVFRKYED